MGRISKGVELSSLKHTSDWYLTEQALQDANDVLITIKNNLDLPEVHRKDSGQLHTASDGQNILLKTVLQPTIKFFEYNCNGKVFVLSAF